MLGRSELREQILGHTFLGLVAVEHHVAKRANRVVERDGQVRHGFVRIVEQRQQRSDHAEHGFARATESIAVIRSLGVVRPEELERAVDQVYARDHELR